MSTVDWCLFLAYCGLIYYMWTGAADKHLIQARKRLSDEDWEWAHRQVVARRNRDRGPKG